MKVLQERHTPSALHLPTGISMTAASLASLTTVLVLASLGCARVLLYDTETSGTMEQFDCIYHRNGSSTVKYCIRSDDAILVDRRLRTDCLNGGVKWLLSELLNQNITPKEVLLWSSSVEAADNYAAGFYNISLNNTIGKFVCACTREGTFGKYCEYELYHDSISFEQALKAQFSQKQTDEWGNQEWGDILCYNTLSCNYGMRCLDWRHVCDGEQQCMDGKDEENCDKLEFNECEEDEYRCVNGMCIAEDYWIDGEADCMDMSDERLDAWGLTCPFEPRSMDCDEHVCFRERTSCGDGQCIQPKDYFVFQTFLPFDWHCLSLREFSHMCETSTRWRLWTKTNGLCTNLVGYDDPLLNMNNDHLSDDDKCVYLIRCALSRGLERDCPCDHNNCSKVMEHVCKSAGSYAYPVSGVIRPFIKTYYDWNRDDWLSKTPDRLMAEGSLKCRGFHAIVNGSELNYTIYLIDRTMIDFRVCTEISVHRNVTSSLRYDESCWNNSLTFRNRSYAYYNICQVSRECISQYRIRDGYQQCGDEQDEDQMLVYHNFCFNLRKHRLQCSLKQDQCLFVYKLGNSYDDCENAYDERFYGTGSPITEVTCNTRNEVGCSLLRDYIGNMSTASSTTDITSVARKYQRIPFRSHCNSFWNTDSRMDELAQHCYHWVCRSDQYQCTTGQCINLDWVCDGEWDCADASDEQSYFLLNGQSPHNRAILDLKNRTRECHKRYVNQSFSSICNISSEFPCYVSNVTNPLDIETNRPCVKLTQLGDGVEDCHGALDEKNTFPACNGLMLGLSYGCTRDSCVRYPYACDKKSDICMDENLCAYKIGQSSWCSKSKDVVCLDKTCKKNARCNDIIECTHGEDELWCSSKTDYYGQRFYRWSKEMSLEYSQILFLPTYPPLMPSQAFDEKADTQHTSLQLPRDINRNVRRVQTFYNHSYICNRGLAVCRDNGLTVCFCPPAYHGSKCQYYSDRLTVITHLDLNSLPIQIPSISSSIFTVFVTLVYVNRAIDYHRFHVNSAIGSNKQRFYLLYSRSKKMLQHKQERYFNRTDIGVHHPYSVRFDLYKITENSTDELGSWHHTIFFDFLPSFRLATVLKFPVWLSNATANPCVNNTCNANSNCYPIFNQKNSFYCSCKSGFHGPECKKYDARCFSFCSSHSICKAVHQGIPASPDHPLCICPLNHFGPRCNLQHNECESSPCANNATCRLTYDPSGVWPFVCACSKQFYGDHCQFEKVAIRIELNTIVPALASVVQFYDVHNSTLELLIQHQQVHVELPNTIRFDHGRAKAPMLGTLKVYDHTRTPKLFVLYIQPNVSRININSKPAHCPHSTILLLNDGNSTPTIFKYHQLCCDVPELLCFHDDHYLCICQEGHNRTDCFGHALDLDQCSSCLSGGKCIRGDLNNDKDFVCLCPQCYQGRMCEFSTSALGYTLDSLLIDDSFTIQIVYVTLAALMFFIGLLNNLGSFVTFKRPQPRKINVGIYLLTVSVLNQCALLWLLLKCISIIVRSFGDLTNISFTNLISCKMLSYLLSVSTRTTYWLTSWVTLDRLCMAVFPTAVIIKNPKISKWSSALTLIILNAMHVHEVFHYTVIQDQSGSTVCITSFENPIVAKYNQMNTLFNYVCPFALQTGAITLLIVLTTRSRAKATSAKIPFWQVLKKQFFTQRELYVTPIIIIVSALPQLVLSFSLACTQLREWQRHILVGAYLLSYGPQVLGFILFVLPSRGFTKEFSQTSIGKMFALLFELTSQQQNVKITTNHAPTLDS